MEKLSSILSPIFNNIGFEDAVVLKMLRKQWDSIFNAPIAKHTFPKEIKENTLIVIVDSNAWLNELILLKDDFLSKLLKYGIKDVVFKFGRIYKQRKNRKFENKLRELSEEQKCWINDVLKDVREEEIKLMMKNVLTKYLIYVNSDK
ncbi:DciA family protein [Thermodesulfovibrio hydrogeniphilus]